MPTGIARRFASDEAQKPSAATTIPSGPSSAPVEARRAAVPILEHKGAAAPTTLKAPDLGKSMASETKKPRKPRETEIPLARETKKSKELKSQQRGRPKRKGKAPWEKASMSKATWYRLKAKANAKR
jgi:hypothetical protein